MDHPSGPAGERPPPPPRAELRSFDEVIYRIGVSLSAELNLDNLVQMLTDEATALCGAQFGSFFYNVMNASGESYMLYTLSGAPRDAFEKIGMPRNTALFEPTFAGTGTVRLADVTEDPRYGKNAPHQGMPEGHLPVRSYLAVPVKSRSGEVLGGLFFGHAEVGVFTERDERVLVGIAAQAAIAIDNARLYQKAVAVEDALKKSLASEQRAREEAERERSRIAALFMQAPAAIAIWRGPTHVFELANPRYAQMMSREALVGRSLREVFPELAGQGLYELFDRAYASGEPVVLDAFPTLFDRHGTGERVEGFFTFNLHPMRALDGSIDGLMVVAVDVTDQIVLRRKERAAREALEKSTRELGESEERERGARRAAEALAADIAQQSRALEQRFKEMRAEHDRALARLAELEERR